MLERDAPYVQIIDHYRQEIRADRLKYGDVIPSNQEIAAQFGVSLATAAKVAGGLQALGLVTPRPGGGLVICAGEPPADKVTGGPFLVTLAVSGPLRPDDTARVLGAELVQAPTHVAEELGVAPLAPVIRRRQVTVRDGATAAMLTSWYPEFMAQAVPALLGGTPFRSNAPGYQPVWGEDWVSARPSTSDEAREFGITRGDPVVVAHSRRQGVGDTVLEYAELVARGDTRIVYCYRYVTGEA